MVLCLTTALGCQNSKMALQHDLTGMQEQLQLTQNQNRDLQIKYQELMQTNARLLASTADRTQQYSVNDMALAEARNQIKQLGQELADLKGSMQTKETKIQALTASLERRGGIEIKPNSSLVKDLPQFPGVAVQAELDGDVIKIPLPDATVLDSNGNAVTEAGLKNVLLPIATTLQSRYPYNRIGVEGHAAPMQSGDVTLDHQRSSEAAMAVYRTLARHSPIGSDRLMVTSYGSNFAANMKPDARIQVNLIVYPDQVR